MPITPESMLGPYRIAGIVGEGGMGVVYRAKDTRLGRDVAIKVLTHVATEDQERLLRFEQEARATGILNHPNLLTIYDVGHEGGAPYIVSELLEGETLRDRLGRGALPPRRAIDAALQVAQGLAAAHEKGIIHRDLKPENIFLTRDGRAKILDFGIAKLSAPTGEGAFQGAATEPGMVLGTVGYMSPEQVRGEPVDTRSDIFSFGAILYEMLTGAHRDHLPPQVRAEAARVAGPAHAALHRLHRRRGVRRMVLLEQDDEGEGHRGVVQSPDLPARRGAQRALRSRRRHHRLQRVVGRRAERDLRGQPPQPRG